MSIHLGTSIDGKTKLFLPLDIATESVSIIARKGMGKTHTARVIAEGLLSSHVQVVVVDPLDVWWGIRVAKSGNGDGCNIIIFGGSHADLPLTETSGKALADFVVEHGISAVLVTDHLSIAASRRFLADFGERLYERKSVERNRTPVSLIIDEADRFAPQQVSPDAARCTGVIDELARRGRSRGLGIVAISQRPAALNKNILTQTEILICLQVTSPQDRKALQAWIEAQADDAQAKLFLDTLAGFQRGQAWVWSPSKLRIFERVQVRDVQTYDSSYTPKIGENRPASPRLREVDLEALRGQLETTIQEAAANDPAKLKQRIRELEHQAVRKPSNGLTTEEANTIRAAAVHRVMDITSGRLRKVLEQINQLQATLANEIALLQSSGEVHIVPRGQSLLAHQDHHPAHTLSKAKHAPAPHADDVSKGERAVLSVLAVAGNRTTTQRKAAILSGYRLTSSTWRGILAKLRSKTAIDTLGDGLVITQSGRELLGDVDPMPTGSALIDHWRGELGRGVAAAIFEALVSAYPRHLTKQEMAEAAGISPDNSTLRGALAKLTALELITGRGETRIASAELMGAA